MGPQQLITLFRESSSNLKDEFKEQFRFSKVQTGNGDEWFDRSAETRTTVAKVLYGTAISHDLPLLHYLIEQEARYCSEIWSSTDTLYQLAMTIFYLGDLSSIPVLWRSKITSFDTYAVIGSRELFGAGIDETMDYLKATDFPEKDEIVKYLHEELASKPIQEAVAKLRERLNERFSTM